MSNDGSDVLTPIVPFLSEVSSRDALWDKHKLYAEQVSELYRLSDYGNYSDRIRFCAQYLEFQLTVLGTLKLKSARFCRIRHCPICQWRRSLMWKARAYQGLPRVIALYPKHRWIFLTLTVRNCEINDLRKTVDYMNESFARMTKLAAWVGDGWIKSLEVTAVYDCYDKGEYLGRHGTTWVSDWQRLNKRKLRLEITDMAHPHFHVLLMVPGGYFGGRKYMNQQEWIQLWKRSLRVDYDPSVRVNAVKQTADPLKLIPEIMKYQTKESDLVSDANWLTSLTEQMHKVRSIALGGVLREHLRELEDEPEDLIGSGDEPEAVTDVVLFFGWRRDFKKYKVEQ